MPYHPSYVVTDKTQEKSVHVTMSGELYQKLKDESRRREVSIRDIVRELIEEHFQTEHYR